MSIPHYDPEGQFDDVCLMDDGIVNELFESRVESRVMMYGATDSSTKNAYLTELDRKLLLMKTGLIRRAMKPLLLLLKKLQNYLVGFLGDSQI